MSSAPSEAEPDFDSVDDVAILRQYAKKYKEESSQKAAAHKELQSKMTIFVGKYQKLDAQLKQKTDRVKELETKVNQSVMMQSQSQVAMQNAAAFEQKAEQLERQVQRLQKELTDISQALKSKQTQYDNIHAKLNEMAAVQKLNNSADEIKKLKEANRRLKMEADDLKSRLQKAEKLNANTFASAGSQHVVSSSDDEGGYHQLNSSFNSIKSEDGNEPTAPKAALEAEDDDDLLALLDDAIPTASAPVSASSFKEPEPEPEKKKPRAKGAATTVKAKNASSKKSAASTAPSAASPAVENVIVQPCNHASEIKALAEENDKLKAELRDLTERNEALLADLLAAQQEARSSQEQLVSLRQRLADMLGIPFSAPAAPISSVPIPAAPARVAPPPALKSTSSESISSTHLVFGIPDADDDDIPATLISASAFPAAQPVVVSQRSSTPPPTAPSKSKSAASKPPSTSTMPPPVSAAPASSAAASAPVRAVTSTAETEHKKTKKRAAPSESPASSTPEARPSKKAKIDNAPVSAAPTKSAVVETRQNSRQNITSESKNAQQEQSKLRAEIEAAIRNFPSTLLTQTPAELFLALLKPESSGKCFSDKVLHTIIALLRKDIAEHDTIIESLFAAVLRQEKETSMETIFELDLDRGRLVESRMAAALDTLVGDKIESFLDTFADVLLSSPRTTIFYVMNCRIFVALAKRTGQLGRAQAFVTDLLSHINSLSSCIASICACYNEWKPIFSSPSASPDVVLDTIKFILLRCSQDIKKSHTGIYNLFQRTKSDLGWAASDRAEEQSLPDFKSPFTQPIEKFIHSFADSLIVSRGGYPAPLQQQLTRSLKCIEMLCVRMPESWIRAKVLNWILSLMSDDGSTRDVQARALLASGPLLSSLLESSKDPKLLEQLLRLLPAILSAPTFARTHRAAAARVAEYLCSNAVSVASREPRLEDALMDYHYFMPSS